VMAFKPSGVPSMRSSCALRTDMFLIVSYGCLKKSIKEN